MSGIGAYESNLLDTIWRMIDEGALPWGETCAVSGRPTSDILHFQVKLDVDDGWRDRIVTWLTVIYMFGPLLAILFAVVAKPFAVPDTDDVAIVPVRVDRKYHRSLAWWGTQAKLRVLLSKVPVYARLLEEHPLAKIRVKRATIRH
jgi:hypothetical protein